MTEAKQNRLVWTEIPVTNLERASNFYETLLEAPLTKNEAGPQPIMMLPYEGENASSGHLYEGKPATEGDGITAHLAVDGYLDDAMKRVKKGGGEVVSEVILIPAGSFFYAKDTEGNSLGIFKN
ncbi:VOC family protein [Sphingorhabdus sp. Alg231-15]|uniref:VOC family protein n=1 Tax=Sphingorhabdus sp. Alg231-15 TaxID=1922222 RepID=UPI000D54C582